MKIKLNNVEVSTLEAYVLDKIESNKMFRVKSKFLNPDRNGFFHLSDDEYLFTLTCCENNMNDKIMSIYESLIKQDNKGLIEPMIIQHTII